jgi:ACS family glucarate transporter-like MFS transporter
MANGVLGSFMSVGSAVAATVTGVLLGYLSWRWLFVIYGLPGILWALGFFLWFRDRPAEHPSVNAAELDLICGPSLKSEDQLEEGLPEPTPWLAIFTSPAMMCICGQAVFRSAAYMFYTTWFTTFLKEARGVTDDRLAGFLTSLPFWAVVVGSPLGGLLSDRVLARTGNRRLARTGVAFVAMLASALFILLAYPVADVWLFVLLITASSFIASFGGPCGYTVTIDMGGKHITTVFAVMNMAGNVGALLFPVVVSRLRVGTGNWNAVLFLFAGIYLAAALCWLPINPDRPIVGRPPANDPRS